MYYIYFAFITTKKRKKKEERKSTQGDPKMNNKVNTTII